MVKFSGLTIFEIIINDKVPSPNFSLFPRQVKHVCFPSISHERDPKSILGYQHDTENYTD